MDYTAIITELGKASLFDLYRLSVAIDQQLNDPSRLRLIKNHLTVGQLISYFDRTENRLIKATIIELKTKKVLIENEHDGCQWNIPYCLINIDNSDTDINLQAKHQTNKNHVKVGDHVCFKDKQGNEMFGIVTKLNSQTAGILVGNMKWRVSYSLLSPIISIETGENVDSSSIVIDI
ncbi:hypothetical protein ACN4EE_12610 [Geminocystis sp. CENA526]|uniref:hypothetical protein n=1 Tax=Geminocystis sp. CENA526 TaxID=1355871 RepID=UPI003D6F3A42